MTIKTIVTQEDIDLGERHSCQECPIAISLRRTLNVTSLWRLSVKRSTARYIASSGLLVASLPPTVQKFITAFDEGKPVKPIIVTLHFN